jgi:hypothetical protein
MVNTRKKELTASITFRLTPGEKRAVEALVQKRAAEMEAQDFPGDPTTGTYLRGLIRREARAAGISFTADDAPPPAAKRAASKRPSRS